MNTLIRGPRRTVTAKKRTPWFGVFPMSFTSTRPLREDLPHPCGATWDGQGVNFSLFSANATKVVLCLFDADGKTELERIELPEYTDQFFRGWVGDLGPGQVYGYRVRGPTNRRRDTGSIRTSWR